MQRLVSELTLTGEIKQAAGVVLWFIVTCLLLYCWLNDGHRIRISMVTEDVAVSVVAYVYRQKHPLNLIILGLYTLCLHLTVGKIVLEALILTSDVVASLTRWSSEETSSSGNLTVMNSDLMKGTLILITIGDDLRRAKTSAISNQSCSPLYLLSSWLVLSRLN
ncbi:hypothetical protein HYC85_020325 [Camellia sinensis]|uniref:Uncharacterized protein n=1 Tax=Camellia sinensis TaxID=4442 RepID=A0A7J7GPG0_CAMSI|nr:hypothetical protein HYC85_020325 [Camellia sinensis]